MVSIPKNALRSTEWGEIKLEKLQQNCFYKLANMMMLVMLGLFLYRCQGYFDM